MNQINEKIVLIISAFSVIGGIILFLLASMWYDKRIKNKKKATINFMYDKFDRFENED